jgi:hypothetical protein
VWIVRDFEDDSKILVPVGTELCKGKRASADDICEHCLGG